MAADVLLISAIPLAVLGFGLLITILIGISLSGRLDELEAENARLRAQLSELSEFEVLWTPVPQKRPRLRVLGGKGE
jgi:hypothetical protein